MTRTRPSRTLSEGIDEALGVLGRLIAFAACAAAMLFVIGIALKPLLPYGLPAGPDGRAIFLLLLAISLLVGLVVAIAVFERLDWSVAGVGAHGWHPFSLVTGAVLGAAAIVPGAAFLLLTQRIDVIAQPPGDFGRYASDALVMLAAQAAVMELAWRGYAFGLIASRWGAVTAIAVTTLLSALAAGFAPGVTGATFGALVAQGLFFATVRHRSGLPAAWLAHVVIGAVQLLALRTPLPGVGIAPPAWRSAPADPAWLTGGAWGIEGGAAVALTLLVISFLPARTTRTHRRT